MTLTDLTQPLICVSPKPGLALPITERLFLLDIWGIACNNYCYHEIPFSISFELRQ
jgi:hypothetical protein